MGYKIKMPYPPRYRVVGGHLSDVETQLSLPANSLQRFEDMDTYYELEFINSFTPTTVQKTTFKATIKALYEPDVP